MIGALNMFDVSPINAGMQAGMQRGAVNSPFTPLGQALKGTLDAYNKNRAMQQEQAYKMQQIDAQGRNALDVAEAQKEPVSLPTKEQIAEIEANKTSPFVYVDDETGVTLTRNLAYDPKSRMNIPTWKSETQPDYEKLQTARFTLDALNAERATQGLPPMNMLGQVEESTQPNVIQQGAAGSTANFSPEDLAYMQKMEEMARKFKAAQVPTSR